MLSSFFFIFWIKKFSSVLTFLLSVTCNSKLPRQFGNLSGFIKWPVCSWQAWVKWQKLNWYWQISSSQRPAHSSVKLWEKRGRGQKWKSSDITLFHSSFCFSWRQAPQAQHTRFLCTFDHPISSMTRHSPGEQSPICPDVLIHATSPAPGIHMIPNWKMEKKKLL